MITYDKIGVGEFPDITWAGDSLYLIFQQGSRLVVEWRNPDLKLFRTWHIPILGGAGAFGRITHHDNRVYVGYRLGAEPYTGHVHVLDVERPANDLGQVHGALPIVFGESGFAYIAGSTREGYPVHVQEWTGALHKNVRQGQGTGLSRLDNVVSVTLVDEDFNVIPGLYNPAWAGPCVIGAADRDGQKCIVAQLPDGKECELWKGQDSPNPRICTDGRNYYAVVWSGEGEGVRIAKFSNVDFRTPSRPAFGVPVATPRALGYFFGKRSKYGEFNPKETCAVAPLDAWQDSDGSLPSDVGDQLLNNLRDCGVGIISNTAIQYSVPEWKRVIGVFAGHQEGNVWAHEPTSRAEATTWVNEARATMDSLKLPRRPVIVVLREDFSRDSQFVGVSEALAPEIYFTNPELTYDLQLSATRKRIDEVCAALTPSKLYLCIQAFDRIVGGNQWKNAPWALEAIQQAANEAITRGQILGLLWFAYARPGGVRAYPALESWHVAQIAVSPSFQPIVDPKPPKPPIPGDEMTEEEIRKWSRELQDTPLFGAMQRYHNEVLPRDRPLDSIVKNADGTDMWTGDVVTGGANAYLVRSMMGEYYIARSKGRNADQALGDGFDAAIKSYNQGPGGNPQ